MRASRLIDDRPQDGVFSVHRDVYTDQKLFALEREHIFEKTWNFLGFETAIPNPHDFFRASIGRTPIVVARDRAGRINAFLNRCRHKGALVCQAAKGSARVFVCPYHGWSYDSSGRNLAIKDRQAAAYPKSFEALDHGLEKIARLGVYKGLVFGSLHAGAPDLDAFLAPVRLFIDIVMDQGPRGVEPLPGRCAYTFKGNWKLQLDNGLDPYHLTSTHNAFVSLLQRRARGEGNTDANSLDFTNFGNDVHSIFSFPYGHSAFLADLSKPPKRPYIDMEEIGRRLSAQQAATMGLTFNLSIFPNLQIIQSTATAVRLIRPLACDATEMRYYCIGAIGEGRPQRAARIRAFEDFFNVSGLATPDDNVVYERCQSGLESQGDPWFQGYSRGMARNEPGANARARELGLAPLESLTISALACPEVALHAPYREWARMMQWADAEVA